MTFDIEKSIQHPQFQDDALFFIDSIESDMSHELQDYSKEEALDTQIIGGGVMDPTLDFQEDMKDPPPLEPIESEPKMKTSIEEPPALELKELPSHLEYAFLESGSRLPVIIASELTQDEKEKLLQILKRHKKAIAWKSWISRESTLLIVPTKF